jgi:hypothetical protein
VGQQDLRRTGNGMMAMPLPHVQALPALFVRALCKAASNFMFSGSFLLVPTIPPQLTAN